MLNGYEYDHQLRCVEYDCDHEVIAMRCKRSQFWPKVRVENVYRNDEFMSNWQIWIGTNFR